MLVVPENWDKAGSRQIVLPVVRIPAKRPNPVEPVFYLQGGPGQSNFSWAPPDWLLENHDVVFMGYRGVDGTVILSCPEVDRLLKTHAGKDLLSEQARKAYVAAVKQCATAHQQAGVDLSGYTIPGVIEDVEAARTALGYDRINLLSESYGTRVAQIYAYMHPDSLHRLVLIGVNTPGHFIWDRVVLDKMIGHISELCAHDATCSSRTSDFAQTMYDVNHKMPKRWLFFNIDPDTIRLGTQFMFLDNPNMPMIFDMYLAAGEGDPSGLAMLNLIVDVPHRSAEIRRSSQQSRDGGPGKIWRDRERQSGEFDHGRADGRMDLASGEGMAHRIDPPKPARVPGERCGDAAGQRNRGLLHATHCVGRSQALFSQSTDGPPAGIQPYRRRVTLQPKAFERLVTSYYDTGVADEFSVCVPAAVL